MLRKEDIYINLQGKTKEELTELWEFLNNAGEKQFRETINDFFNNYDGWIAYEFSCNYWLFSSSKSLNEKTEVTIEQLKEILQPMENKEEFLRKEAIKRGFVNGVKFYGSEGAESDEPMLINDNIKYMKPEEEDDNWGLYVKNSWLCFNGKWGTLIEETLQQQLEKAKAEVDRLEKEIENKKIKVGDWVINTLTNVVFKVVYLDIKLQDHYKKITNPQLIILLENEIK